MSDDHGKKASSAVYRYFASREDFLTRLIVEAFDALGEAAEKAYAASAGRAPGERWLEVSRGVRAWSLAHPHEHALVFGTPIPGYAAPETTVEPAMRVPRVLAAVLGEAAASGQLAVPARPLPAPSLASPQLLAMAGTPPDPYGDVLERALLVWTSLIGSISSELFGHIHGAITDEGAFFERCTAMTAELAGLSVPMQ